MPKDKFDFKTFCIHQPYKDVMKVSTDSVLLGSFVNATNTDNALDIGCGTGLLALMLAHKNPKLDITAIDINENACKCAVYNVQHSDFASKIIVKHTSLQDFVKTNSHPFDVIVCNPPYFSKYLKSPDIFKNTYRHQNELTYEVLIDGVKILMKDTGKFYVIVPYYEYKKFIGLLHHRDLHIHSQLSVFSNTEKQIPYIFILEIKKNPATSVNEQHLFIHNNKNEYTSEYIDFTREFYLYF
ncbi:MAG: methyltransferase [Bacteroidia bacterium]